MCVCPFEECLSEWLQTTCFHSIIHYPPFSFSWRALSIFAAFGCLLVYSTLKGASELESFRASSSSPSHNHHLLVRREAEGNITEGIGEEEVKNCSEPAYQEFPSDGFTNAQRSGGAIVIHVLIVSCKFTRINRLITTFATL